jgi:Ni2+-binding GTPase involved in maturation of urease and hydrogenase
MSQARYIMVGGFLGAGKTTLINRLARHLVDQGRRVGLITNDQGMGLADTVIGRAHHFPVEEITGGCFCCRFNSLIEAARHLRERDKPDVFLAEPVGSCTDLVATVSLPLEQIYGAEFVVAPLSVVIDPVRALRVLGVEEGKRFSPNVLYIYRKQLEEAEAIVINKADVLVPSPGEGGSSLRLTLLQEALREEFWEAQQWVVSARDGTGLEEWFDFVLTQKLNVGRVMGLDYAKYGEGEALLGWFNATVLLSGEGDEWDGNALLVELASELRHALAEPADGISAPSEIAHLKMTLSPAGDPGELAAVNLVGNDREPELSHRLADPLEDGELLLNLRAEADPDALDSAVRAALADVGERGFGLRVDISHAEHFRPGQPQPTHRVTAPSSY